MTPEPFAFRGESALDILLAIIGSGHWPGNWATRGVMYDLMERYWLLSSAIVQGQGIKLAHAWTLAEVGTLNPDTA